MQHPSRLAAGLGGMSLRYRLPPTPSTTALICPMNAALCPPALLLSSAAGLCRLLSWNCMQSGLRSSRQQRMPASPPPPPAAPQPSTSWRHRHLQAVWPRGKGAGDLSASGCSAALLASRRLASCLLIPVPSSPKSVSLCLSICLLRGELVTKHHHLPREAGEAPCNAPTALSHTHAAAAGGGAAWPKPCCHRRYCCHCTVLHAAACPRCSALHCLASPRS